LDISDCLFTGNQAVGGAGVEKAKGGDGLGGALYRLGTATPIDRTITGDQVQGGGIHNEILLNAQATVLIEDPTAQKIRSYRLATAIAHLAGHFLTWADRPCLCRGLAALSYTLSL
jgi:hypothetical protein